MLGEMLFSITGVPGIEYSYLSLLHVLMCIKLNLHIFKRDWVSVFGFSTSVCCSPFCCLYLEFKADFQSVVRSLSIPCNV